MKNEDRAKWADVTKAVIGSGLAGLSLGLFLTFGFVSADTENEVLATTIGAISSLTGFMLLMDKHKRETEAVFSLLGGVFLGVTLAATPLISGKIPSVLSQQASDPIIGKLKFKS